MENCNTNITIIQTEEPCNGSYLSTNCTSIPNNLTYLDLSAGDNQTTVNAAIVTALMYKDEQIASLPIPDGSETKLIAGDNVTVTGEGTTITPYIVNSLYSPFNTLNDSYFPRSRDETQYGTIGQYAYDFSLAALGSYGDIYGQVGQIGIHPTEQYGALGESTYTFGYNLSAGGYGDSLFGQYNHSDTQSQFSTVFGRNNYNNSYNTMLSGSYNIVPYTYLGHKTLFGNGNVVNGSAGLTSGVALLNKSFSTTVLGQANLDYVDTSEGVNNSTAPILIIGNGDVVTPIGIWTASSRSDALKLLKNGLLTLPSVTNVLISEASGKAVITKEYLPTVSGDYASDAAAAIGGILLGQLYHTNGTVKIRLV